MFELIDADSGRVIVPRLSIAATFLRRFRGLQFRRKLPPDEGLLIVPCRSIHTHWMRFAIDVAMIDRDGVVLETHVNVRPWRMVRAGRNVFAVLETALGSIKVSPGDTLHVVPETGSKLPKIPSTLISERGKEN